MRLHKVYPLERISKKNTGVATASIRLDKSKYYVCPHCHSRTLIRHQEVSPFANKKTPKDFDESILESFKQFGTTQSFSIGADRTLESYDFFCRGCQRPIRLLYDFQERGMGGRWSVVVYAIIEQA